MATTPPKNLIDCYWFLQGQCSKEKSCEYRHCEKTTVNEEICANWTQGKCSNLNCPNRHPSTGIPSGTKVCFYFTHGGCKKGSSCPFSHSVELSDPSLMIPLFSAADEDPELEAIKQAKIQQQEELRKIQEQTQREQEKLEKIKKESAMQLLRKQNEPAKKITEKILSASVPTKRSAQESQKFQQKTKKQKADENLPQKNSKYCKIKCKKTRRSDSTNEKRKIRLWNQTIRSFSSTRKKRKKNPNKKNMFERNYQKKQLNHQKKNQER